MKSHTKMTGKVDTHFANGMMAYADKMFHKCFRAAIILKDCMYDIHSMGFFRLEYLHPDKGLSLAFESDRMFFSIWIKDASGKAVAFTKINEKTKSISSGLSEKNVTAAVEELYRLIQQDDIIL